MGAGDDIGVQSPNFGYLTRVPKGALDRFEPVRSRQTVMNSSDLRLVRDPDYQQAEGAVVTYYAEVRSDALGCTEVAEIQDIARGNKQRIQYTSANGRCRITGRFNENLLEGPTSNLDFDASGRGLRIEGLLLGISGGVTSVLEPRGTFYMKNGPLPINTGQSATVPFNSTRTRSYFPPSLGQENTHILADEVLYAALFQLSAEVVDAAQPVPNALVIPNISFEFWVSIATPVIFS